MNKIWIKLLSAYDGKSAGEILELDEPIARTLITAKIAEENKGAETALVASALAEVQSKFKEFETNTNTAIANAFRSLAASVPAAASIGHIEVIENEEDKKFRTGGFKSPGHFATAVFRGMNPSTPDQQYQEQLIQWRSLVATVTRAQATGLNEAADPEGALLIPSDHATTLWERSRQTVNLSTRFPVYPIAGNGMTWNADAESSRANGSRRGGVLGYWEGEAQQHTKSKPAFRKMELKLKKLTVFVYATNELLEDTGGALEAYVNRVAPEEIAFKINDAVVAGTGAGMPLGYMNSPAKVVVPAVSGQGANTITAQNIDDMWARRLTASENDYVWLYNQEIEPQLQRLYYSTGSNSGQLVYMPPGGISGTKYATLKGREMINCEQCEALGTEGDLALVNFADWVGIVKSSGPQQAVSIHLRFDYDETVFKFSTRFDAQCAHVAPLTPYKGSKTQSPVITLNSSRT